MRQIQASVGEIMFEMIGSKWNCEDFTLWTIQSKHDNLDAQSFNDKGVAFLSFYTVERKYHVRYLTKQKGCLFLWNEDAIE